MRRWPDGSRRGALGASAGEGVERSGFPWQKVWGAGKEDLRGKSRGTRNGGSAEARIGRRHRGEGGEALTTVVVVEMVLHGQTS